MPMRFTMARQPRAEELLDVVAPRADPRRENTASDDVMEAQPGLPRWIWVGIAACLGIRLKPGQRPIIATAFYVLGLTSGFCAYLELTGAFTQFCVDFLKLFYLFFDWSSGFSTPCFAGYVASNFWFSVYNTLSIKTHDDVVDGFVSVLISICWVGLGLYSRRLALKLLRSRHIVPMIRLHARTVFKLNASLVLAVLLLAFVVLSNVSATRAWMDDTCRTVDVEIVVCKVRYLSRLIFSGLFFLWNLLVGVVMISLCRTHTLNIRAVIAHLDADAASWPEEENQQLARRSPSLHKHREGFLKLDDEWSSDDGGPDADGPPPLASDARRQSAAPSMVPVTDGARMSSEQVMHEFWKVSRELTISSLMFQQWLMCVIGLTICWTVVHLVYWLRHAPTVSQVGEIFVPVLLLPLLTSSYAQVNTEAYRMIRSIRPSKDRLDVLLHLSHAPPQMTIYGHPLSYGTIVTAISAVLLAFFSKILLSEIAAAF